VRKQEITCPSCHKVLSMEWRVSDAMLTCPSCLASITNPSEAVQTAAPAPMVASAPASTCRGCGKPVEAAWNYCPHCNEPLRWPRREKVAQEAARLDADVKKDAGVSAVFFGVLMVLVLAGIVLLPVVAGTGVFGRQGGGVLIVGLVLFVLLLVGGIGLMAKSTSAAKTTAGILFGVGMAFLFPCAFMALIAAVCSPPAR
jgi:hypothetical protein